MGATAAAPLPSSIEKLVQNAEAKHSVAEAVAGHEAVLEPKFDGWRIIFQVEETASGERRARAFTRKGKELTGKMPAIEAELARALPAGSCVDGEVVVFEVVNGVAVPAGSNAVGTVLGSGTAKAALASGKLSYVIFDLLSHGGIDARPLPLSKRRGYLEMVRDASDFAPCVQIAPQLPATDAAHDALLAAGFEGSIVKWADAPYKSGYRGWGWFKLKGEADCDVVVMGYKPGENSWEGMVGAIVFGQFDGDGLLVERGRCSGIDFDTRVAITKNPEGYLGKVFTMRHNGVFDPSAEHPHGAFRHPRFKTWRPDKPLEAVTLHDE